MTDVAVSHPEAPAAVTRRTMTYLGSLYHYAVAVQLADIGTALDFRDWVADAHRLDDAFMTATHDLEPLWRRYLAVVAAW